MKEKNENRIRRYKSLTAVVLILLMCSSFFVGVSPNVDAQTTTGRTVTTGAYLSIAPDVVGVEQQVRVTFWVEPIHPIYDLFHNYQVTITDPNGKNETKGPYTSLGEQSVQHFSYTPKIVGNYTFQFSYPGETFDSLNDTYTAAISDPATLVVQEEPITDYPQTALPTEYWSRPINAEDSNWASISGNWLFLGYNATNIGYGDSWGGYNPYTTAPLSSHIMWTQQMTTGGLVGGENTGSYYSGATYNPYLTPAVVMNGLAYYRTEPSWATSAASNNKGFKCVDLQTGEVLWQNDTGNIDFGQVWNYAYSTSGQGSRAYLWGNTMTSNWDVYDAFTGRWLFGYSNGYSTNQWIWWPDAAISTEDGTICVFLLDGLNGWLAEWNSTKAFTANGISISNPDPKYYDWTLGLEYNVTVPLHLVDSTTTWTTDLVTTGATRQGISGNVLLAKVTDGSEKVYYEIGYDITTGEELWVHDEGDSVQTFFTVMGEDIYASFDIVTASWVGYDLNTGKKLWTSDSFTGWGDFQSYGNVIADGILYSGGWDGYLRAIDITTGDIMWESYAGDAGTSTPYGSWPFWGGTIVGGDTVFSATGQESPSNPLFKGNRLFAFDSATGQGLWNISGYFAVRALADGYLLAFNSYDNNVYCFGKGPSQTTVNAPNVGVQQGQNVIISGTVLDIAHGTDSLDISARFPNGVACVSNESQTAWMEYVYMQKTKPTDVTGVSVELYVIDSNGNYRNIGTTTTDANGYYSYNWIPDITGKYTVHAVFSGDNSYYGSQATSSFVVDETTATATPQPTQTPSSVDLYFVPAIASILAAIAAVGIILAILTTRKHP